MARPRTPIDKEQVRKLAAIDCTVAEIAAIMGVSRDTIERRCRAELTAGREQGNASIRRKQHELAMAGNVTMLIWLGKQRLNQVDRQAISGDAGMPIRHTIEVVREPQRPPMEDIPPAVASRIETNGHGPR